MPALRNVRREQFCMLVALGGLNYTQAYAKAYGRDAEERTTMVNASRLLKYAEVKNRVAELRQKNTKPYEWTKKERLRQLKEFGQDKNLQAPTQMKANRLYGELVGELGRNGGNPTNVNVLVVDGRECHIPPGTDPEALEYALKLQPIMVEAVRKLRLGGTRYENQSGIPDDLIAKGADFVCRQIEHERAKNVDGMNAADAHVIDA